MRAREHQLPRRARSRIAEGVDNLLGIRYYMCGTYMCKPSDEEAGPVWCGRAAGRMPGFFQPWLLLFLAERPAHGYELLERLRKNDDTCGVDPGALYRTLRQFERDAMVRSSWNTTGGGPARRVYEIAPPGVEYLDRWAEHIRGTRERLGRVLEAYERRSVRNADVQRR